MSWITIIPWLGTAIFGIAGSVGIWYYRSRALDAEGDQETLKLAITNSNTATLAAQAEAKQARDALATKLRENHDQDSAIATSADASAAAALLTGLHPSS